MTPSTGCSENTDPLKLTREGTNQMRRALAAPDPTRVPVDERRAEHAMVFAAAFAKYLNYYDGDGNIDGNWQEFFGTDISLQLAVAAIEDVAVYRSRIKSWLRSLEDPELPASGPDMIEALGAVFDCLGTLARRLDELKSGLPSDDLLRATLSNLIRSQLSPMLRRLIGYYLAGQDLNVVDATASPPDDVLILGRPIESLNGLVTGAELSSDWPLGADFASWATYVHFDNLEPFKGAYGPGATEVEKVNHLATHNLFTAIGDTFLGVYARVVEEAKAAVLASFEWNGHEPHYALFLAFLRLLEHARAEANTITARHLAFYYREVLRLKERPAQPGQAHVLVELAKHARTHLVAEGALLKAGKDDTGADAHFAVDRDLVANKARVAELKSVYRHHNTPAEQLQFDAGQIHDGRIYASPVANSDDGLGEKLTTPDPSWHPFANKRYKDGSLEEIRMPYAEVGVAIASHYLWLAEGTRIITVEFETTAPASITSGFEPADLLCRLSTEKGWLETRTIEIGATDSALSLTITLNGNDPPITPYDPKVHGYAFATSLPVLVVMLRHRTDASWHYSDFEGVELDGIRLHVKVDGLKSLALSNDHGSIDSSKPFQPFGSAPMANSALVIGSKEAFQKSPSTVTVRAKLATAPVAYPAGTTPAVEVDSLNQGEWSPTVYTVSGDSYLLSDVSQPAVVTPDLTPDDQYSTATRNGFVRFRLTQGFGTDKYPAALAKWIVQPEGPEPPAPVVPTLLWLTLDYSADQDIDLDTSPTESPSESPSAARGRFFHVTPFGHAEQFPQTGAGGVPLLPQFRAGNAAAEGELYIGVRDLQPPQNLALLFQVVDGTANPLVVKPEGHIRWTYLHGNEWVPFAADAVDDGTDGLLASGIVTLAVPADASTEHTLLPGGMHWIRLAVPSASDAVCRLVTVAAQALRATSVVRNNGSISHTYELPPGTITKLDPPDADVKGVAQPFSTFGGRPVETPSAFATRVSERLRHKDRAIALWDYEHLILEAFPGIYQARCLNHLQYEPSTTGTGVYRELAPGHVTVVTIPDLAVPNPRDPLRPFTSLRVLGEIERFLAKRVSCFTRLHVRNPEFEEVRVDLRVRFGNGIDETFHINRLQREITQFLSPWAFRSDARPTFNGKVYKSVLVNFIEERPYVDYISDVHLFHQDPETGDDGADLEEVVGSRTISILVSVPSDEHNIQVMHPDEVVVAEPCACAPRTD